MICKNCGNENKEGVNFCKYCGTKFEKTENVEVKKEAEQIQEVRHEDECQETQPEEIMHQSVQPKTESHIDIEKTNITIKKHEVEINEKGSVKDEEEIEEQLEPLKPVSRMQEAINNLSNKTKKCPACGMMIIDNARFCTNCGLKVN